MTSKDDRSPTHDEARDQTRVLERRRAEWVDGLGRTARAATMAAVAAGIVAGAAAVGQAWALGSLLAAVIIDGRAVADVTSLAGLFLVAVAIRGGATFMGERTAFQASGDIRTRVRLDLAAHLVHLGPSRLIDRPSGEVSAMLVEKVEALDGYLANYLRHQRLAVMVPVLILLVVAAVDWMASLMLLAIGLAAPVAMAIIGQGTMAAAQRRMHVLTRMSGYFMDRLRGLAALRALGQAEAEVGRIERVAEEFRLRTMEILRFAFLSSTVLELLAALAVVGIALYVGLGLAGMHDLGPVAELTVAEGLFLLVLAPEFLMPLRRLAAHYHDRSAAIAAAEGIVDILDRDTAVDGRLRQASAMAKSGFVPAITFDRVGVTHGDGRVALAGIDLEIAAGETVALVGESGAGKSTILSLLAGFLAPSDGTVLITDPTGVHTGTRPALAWVGQSTRLFHGTIAENIRLARPDASDDDVARAAERAGVTAFAGSLPAGLDTLVGEEGHGLSGGEAQRVAVARAFLSDAGLVLMDEPTASLDGDTAAALIHAIRELARDRTVLVATHSLAMTAIADRVIALSDGRVVGDDRVNASRPEGTARSDGTARRPEGDRG